MHFPKLEVLIVCADVSTLLRGKSLDVANLQMRTPAKAWSVSHVEVSVDLLELKLFYLRVVGASLLRRSILMEKRLHLRDGSVCCVQGVCKLCSVAADTNDN